MCGRQHTISEGEGSFKESEGGEGAVVNVNIIDLITYQSVFYEACFLILRWEPTVRSAYR